MATLTQYAVGLVLVAHGWVHFVYAASTRGWPGPGEGWGWSAHSWLLSSVVEEESIGKLASVFIVVVALGFVIGAIGYAFSRERWATVLVGTALLSTFLYTATWDGRFTSLPETGAPGVLVDVAVPAWLLVLTETPDTDPRTDHCSRWSLRGPDGLSRVRGAVPRSVGRDADRVHPLRHGRTVAGFGAFHGWSWETSPPYPAYQSYPLPVTSPMAAGGTPETPVWCETPAHSAARASTASEGRSFPPRFCEAWFAERAPQARASEPDE